MGGTMRRSQGAPSRDGEVAGETRDVADTRADELPRRRARHYIMYIFIFD